VNTGNAVFKNMRGVNKNKSPRIKTLKFNAMEEKKKK
jgi:hypothetical protein